MPVTVKLEGVKDVEAALRRKLDEYRADIEHAVSAEAEELASDWRSQVPVDEGDYRNSIRVEGSGMEAEIGNFGREGWHGMFVEFGTSQKSARPAAGPAAEVSRIRFVERLRRMIR